jgi:nitrite reductase (NO-forming)
MNNPHSTSPFAALILSFNLVGCASTQPSNIAAAEAFPSTVPASKEVLKALEIRAVDLAYEPNALTVAKPGRYIVKLLNTGQMPHDITFPDGTKISAAAGAIAVGEVEVPEDGIGFICSVPGHFHAGMKGEIGVAGARAAVKDTGPAVGTVVEPDPKAPPYRLYDARAPEPLHGSTVHDLDLVIEEKLMTVAPGFVQKVWAFGGKVPGPVIRVKQGDTVRVHLKNPASNEMAHSIDFHSSQAAWNDEMTSIGPGEEKLYEWRADYAGVWMYHCGSPHPLHHMANGLYGMVIVEPEGGFKKVDHEFALVQSEWYLGPQRQPVDLDKAANTAFPDHVVFNGIANQYKDHPLQVDTGKRVRMFVLNAGPSKDSSFHIVGTIFDTVIKEGVNLTPDNPGHYGSQAVDLGPAQGAIIEFTTAEDGLYPIVTHAFNFVGRGALGLVKAGDGDPKETALSAK